MKSARSAGVETVLKCAPPSVFSTRNIGIPVWACTTAGRGVFKSMYSCSDLVGEGMDSYSSEDVGLRAGGGKDGGENRETVDFDTGSGGGGQ
jgi:hypothetical protein